MDKFPKFYKFIDRFVEWVQENGSYIEVTVWLNEEQRTREKAGRRYAVPIGKDADATKVRFLSVLEQFIFTDVVDQRVVEYDDEGNLLPKEAAIH